MSKVRADPIVRKTLVRNSEQKLKPNTRKQAVYDVRLLEGETSGHIDKEIDLSEPTLCSSKLFDAYLSDIKRSELPSVSADDLNVEKEPNSAKITKKLNFHINNKIYKNLIQLNISNDSKTKKDKKLCNTVVAKRDVEPNIEDFYEEVKEDDFPTSIPVIKPKFQPVRKFENGHLHKLVSEFEDL